MLHFFFLSYKAFRRGNEVILACSYLLSERKHVLIEILTGDRLGFGNKGYTAGITKVVAESHFPGPVRAKEA